MDGELKKIKKVYGEDFAKLCRELFPDILEKEGVLIEVLKNTFAPSHFLYNDIIEQEQKDSFQSFIIKLVRQKNNEQFQEQEEQIEVNESPEELLEKAGYDLYKCETYDDVLNFKKYYASGEELCTFKDSKRTQTHEVFFAVKKNTLEIKRENFENPKRQDEYGTSVISIQFNKKNNYLSIKNRYNHTVANCDATFSNNLNGIVKGLKQSFEKYYGLTQANQINEFELDNYVCDVTGKYYFYNVEINKIYYCADNIVIQNGNANKLDKNRFELFDYFCLDKKENKLTCLIDDSFIDEFQDVENIEIVKVKDSKFKEYKVYKKDGTDFTFVVNNKSSIVGYRNDYIEKLNDNFLTNATNLDTFIAPNLKEIGDNCFAYNKCLKHLDCEKVQKIGGMFAFTNIHLKNLYLPNVEEIGYMFFTSNRFIEKLSLPNLKKIDFGFMRLNTSIKEIDLPKVETIENGFLTHNEKLTNLNLQNLKSMGNDCLSCNTNLKEISMPNVEKIGSNFLYENNSITNLILLKVKEIGDSFLYSNEILENIEMPNVETIGNEFLMNNKSLTKLEMYKLKNVESYFLYNNEAIETIQMPNVEMISDEFLYNNRNLKQVIMPKVENICDNFMYYNKNLKVLKMPNLKTFGYDCLVKNKELKELYAPNLIKVGSNFLKENNKLEKFDFSSLKSFCYDFLSKHQNREQIIETIKTNLAEAVR